MFLRNFSELHGITYQKIAKIFGLHIVVGISWPVDMKFSQKKTGCSGEIQILISGN
jgi:hypothetical protein